MMLMPIDPIALAGILAGAVVITAAIVAVTIIVLVKHKQERGSSDEEVRLVQEMERGFDKLQRRVEALETLLLERDRKESLR